MAGMMSQTARRRRRGPSLDSVLTVLRSLEGLPAADAAAVQQVIARRQPGWEPTEEERATVTEIARRAGFVLTS